MLAQMADGSITNNDEYLSYQNRVANVDELRKQEMMGELSSRGDLPVSAAGAPIGYQKSEAADSRAIGSTDQLSSNAAKAVKKGGATPV